MALAGGVTFDELPGVVCNYHCIHSLQMAKDGIILLRVLSYLDATYREQEKAGTISRGWLYGGDKWYELSSEAAKKWWSSGTGVASDLYPLLQAEHSEFASCVSDEEITS